jgi:enoyl-CoA hydratase/carnithine racemase
MSEKWVEYVSKGHIGFITFYGQNEQSGGPEIAEIAANINGDENIYAVVVRGKKDYFKTAAALPETDGLTFPAPAEAVGSINRPTVAVLDGDTLAAGLELALACDMRTAAEGVNFGLPQIKDGGIPAQGGTQRLARLVGKGNALEMVLTGEIIGTARALEIGLVNKVVKKDELEAEVEALAATLAYKAPLAVRFCKEAVNKGLDMTLEQGLRLEADLYFLLHTTSDRTEGVQSFLQKRKPDYQGK